MSQRFDQLKARHSQLLLRTAEQRQHLADTAGDLRHDLGRIDRGIQTLRRVARNPLLLVAGTVVLGVLGPKRLLGWAARGLMYYSTARRLMDARRTVQPPRIRRSSSEA